MGGITTFLRAILQLLVFLHGPLIELPRLRLIGLRLQGSVEQPLIQQIHGLLVDPFDLVFSHGLLRSNVEGELRNIAGQDTKVRGVVTVLERPPGVYLEAQADAVLMKHKVLKFANGFYIVIFVAIYVGVHEGGCPVGWQLKRFSNHTRNPSK